MESAGFRGPFATDELHQQLGMYVAFHLDEPFLGSPVERTVTEAQAGIPGEVTVPEIDARLKRHGVQSFLIHSDWPLLEQFRAETSWQFKYEVPHDSSCLYVYGPPPEVEKQPVKPQAAAPNAD